MPGKNGGLACDQPLLGYSERSFAATRAFFVARLHPLPVWVCIHLMDSGLWSQLQETSGALLRPVSMLFSWILETPAILVTGQSPEDIGNELVEELFSAVLYKNTLTLHVLRETILLAVNGEMECYRRLLSKD